VISDLRAYQEIDGRRVDVNAQLAAARYGSLRLDLGFSDPHAPIYVDFDMAVL
jgi:hypothetical protein